MREDVYSSAFQLFFGDKQRKRLTPKSQRGVELFEPCSQGITFSTGSLFESGLSERTCKIYSLYILVRVCRVSKGRDRISMPALAS